jgi:Leucine-rich repeat (LRR) protein
MIYQPLDRDANCVMSSYASWCTAREGNTMFQSYTSGNKEPGGNPSKIYVIINKGLLKGQTDEVYQFHFETEQYKDRSNGRNIDLYEFFQKNPKLGNFFGNILKKLAIEVGGNIKSNKYLKTLMALGEVDNIFDFININEEKIDLSGLKLPKLPNELNKLKNTTDINANEVGLTEIPSTIGDMDNLEFLLLRGNKIKSLPDTIGKLKKLNVLNLKDNQLTSLPNSITNLDEENGGELYKINLSGNNFSDSEKEKIQILLPNVEISF